MIASKLFSATVAAAVILAASQGAEAQTLRAIYGYIAGKFG